MRTIGYEDIEDLALGATLLGTGGGGDPYIAKLMVKQAIEAHGPIKVVAPSELPPDGLVLTTAVIGAPTVILEKIPSGTEFRKSVDAMAQYLGAEPVALMPIEVGGMNTLIPLATAAEMGLPVIDADSMRRAFPQIEMTVFTLAGLKAAPMCVADEKGNVCIYEATTNQLAEDLARGAVMRLGMANAISCYALTAGQIDAHGIHGSMSYCTDLGKHMAAVQRGEDGAMERFLDFADARVVFTGKITDIERRTTQGFARGTVVLEHVHEPGRIMRIEIQNENLVAYDGDECVVMVPDLISLIDHETAKPVLTEQLAYGQRLDVIAMPCAPEWHQDGMLEVVGPRAFGYDLDYVPLGGAR
ncbi:MAG: DUF917 domain-containing protein [Candidatus Limnocylindrales bacterium]